MDCAASSSVTQCPGTALTLVQMDIVDATSGITLAENGIAVGEAGPYPIVAAPQVGREGGGPHGCFDPWLRINGKDVANSNVQLCQDEGSRAKDEPLVPAIIFSMIGQGVPRYGATRLLGMRGRSWAAPALILSSPRRGRIEGGLSRLLDKREADSRSGKHRGVSGRQGTVPPRHGRQRPTIHEFFAAPETKNKTWMVGLCRP